MIALAQAGQKIKRQVWIKEGLAIAQCPILADKWERRTKHGAHHSIFGEPEVRELAALVPTLKVKPLVVDTQCLTYCKAVVWNRVKLLAKTIKKRTDILFCDYDKMEMGKLEMGSV